MDKIIAPSLLAADMFNLEHEISSLLLQGVTWLHLDVMDNHFVPNLSFGPSFCHALHQKFPTAFIDVHLMLSNPDTMIQDFAKAGASSIAVHYEGAVHLDRSINLIKSYGCKAGVAINPHTNHENLRFMLDKIDFILLMTVNPGFAGQQFIPGMLDKIILVKAFLKNTAVLLEVDGGVNIDNIHSIAECGADIMVAGSAIFGHKNFIQAYQELIAACS